MSSPELAALNAELIQYSVGASVDVEITVASRSFRLQTAELVARRLQVRPSLSTLEEPRARIEISSLDAARRAAVCGPSAAMTLLASGALRMRGNCTEQLQALQNDFQQQMSVSAAARLQALALALLGALLRFSISLRSFPFYEIPS